MINGFRIITDPSMVEQVNMRPRRPHRRPRTEKKWRKRFGMKWDTIPSTQIIVMGRTMIMHPHHFQNNRMLRW